MTWVSIVGYKDTIKWDDIQNTLDLSAAKMTEFSDRVVTIGSERILPVAVIFGANASGKSNVYSAFEYMSNYVVQSFLYCENRDSFW